VNTCGSVRIEAAQQTMKGTGFSALARGQAIAQGLISLGARSQAIDQSAQVKTSTTGHHGQMPARRNLLQGATPQARVFTRGENLVGVKNIYEMVAYILACFRRKLGRTDVEIPVNLQRIAINHLAPETGGNE
jgi:hypothetical protein